MIKINLLPPNIFEARMIKKLIGLFIVVALAIAAGGIGYTSMINKETQQKKAEADLAQQYTEEAQKWEGQASSERAAIAPIMTKRKFFEDIWTYNNVYPDLYEQVAKFTYAKIIYSQLQPGTGSLQISAYAPSLSDAGRYLLNLYRATHLFNSVTISAVPGYPQGSTTGGPPGIPGMPGLSPPEPMSIPGMQGGTTYGGLEAISMGVERGHQAPTGFTFTVTCALKNGIAPPVYGAAGAAAAGAPGGIPPTAAPAAAPAPPATEPEPGMPKLKGAGA